MQRTDTKFASWFIEMMNTIIKELNDLCGSDSLSLTALHEKISQLPTTGNIDDAYDAYDENPFLHTMCLNKNVTLDMVKYVLEKGRGLPDLISWDSHVVDNERSNNANDEFGAYLLHCACYNKHCPGSVIEFLLEENASPIRIASKVNYGVLDRGVKGLPLHYYLARASNIDIEIVRLLAEELVLAYPQAMLSINGISFTPLHAILYNQNIDADKLQDILECLLNLSPSSIRVLDREFMDGDDATPLHLACQSKSVNLEIVQLLFNAWPEAMRMPRSDECLPIHQLCHNTMLDNNDSIDILRFMLDTDQTIARERNWDGELPIHCAVSRHSVEFCKVLIDVHPESLRVQTSNNALPIHKACGHEDEERRDTVDTIQSNADTIQYMLELYPESINARDSDGWLPIHSAAYQLGRTDIIETLLKHDPDGASKKTTNNARQLPIHLACCSEGIEVVQVLYDAFPEALSVPNGRGSVPIDMVRMNEFSNSSAIEDFLEAQLVYAHKAKDVVAMHTLDEKDWLPLHHALKDKAPLGSIKLLLKGNPSAIRIADKNMAFPLHIACEFSSIKVVKYLVELSRIPMSYLDMNRDSILHYACRGGNLEVIKYLLGNHLSLVSDTNADSKLPFQLLLEREDEQVRDSLEYTDVCFRLLQAYPETVTMIQTARKRRRD